MTSHSREATDLLLPGRRAQQCQPTAAQERKQLWQIPQLSEMAGSNKAALRSRHSEAMCSHPSCPERAGPGAFPLGSVPTPWPPARSGRTAGRRKSSLLSPPFLCGLEKRQRIRSTSFSTQGGTAPVGALVGESGGRDANPSWEMRASRGSLLRPHCLHHVPLGDLGSKPRWVTQAIHSVSESPSWGTGKHRKLPPHCGRIYEVRNGKMHLSDERVEGKDPHRPLSSM